jgi:hypothetical protein
MKPNIKPILHKNAKTNQVYRLPFKYVEAWVGLAIFDMTREPNTNTTRKN